MSRRVSLTATGFGLALLVLVLLVLGPPSSSRGEGGLVHVAPPVRQALGQAGAVRVLVELRLSGGPHVAEDDLPSPAAIMVQRSDISDTQLQVLSRMAGKRYRLIHKYETVPVLALEIDPAGLAELEAAGIHVTRIEEDAVSAPGLAQSVPLVEADQAWARGFDGTGSVIAILDTGVESSHPFLAGKVADEACFSSGSGGSFCPNGQAQQTGVGTGRNCPSNVDGCLHGTHVAGIAAGNGAGAGVSFSGVARGARIIAVQVFSRVTDPQQCNSFGRPAPCTLTYSSDQIAGLERVFALRTVHNVVAVNMSLGGGPTSSFCDNDSRKPIIDNLRSARIATVVAAGNESQKAAISKPACISSAVSVGSTTKSDTVAGSSNVASFVSLFAPGDSINSSVLNGGFAFLSGTSMAAPHVAGAWAILRQAAPGATVPEILSALQDTGRLVTDTRAGGSVTRPRIRIASALNRFLAQTVSLGVVPSGAGTGTVTSTPDGIACGATCSANYAIGTTVTLTASPAAGSTFLGWTGGGCSGTGTCSVTVRTTTTITASFGAGTQIVSVARAGTGSGTVTSSPGGISCGSVCTAGYAPGVNVTLTAAAAAGSVFSGWSGACTGTLTSCTVSMSQARSVTATFASSTHTITITSGPSGSPNPVGSSGVVSLSVNVADSFGHLLTFLWTAGCTGLPSNGSLSSATGQSPAWTAPANTSGVEQTCTIQVTVSDGQGLTQAGSYLQRVSATVSTTIIFQDGMEQGTGGWSPQAPWGLTTAAAHTGLRSWTDSPAGSYSNNANVSLFSPSLDLSGSSSVTLTFWHRYDLEDGFDSGNVWITTDNGVTYTQLADFTGTNLAWSQVSLDLSDFAGRPGVQIVFQLLSDFSVIRDGWYIDDVVVSGVRSGLPLTVLKSGGDGGTVTSVPGGISCGATCSATYLAGASVTLTVSTLPGWAFVGWSGGGCAGAAPTCTVTIAAATTVTASFTPAAALPGDDRASPITITSEAFTDTRMTQAYTGAVDDPAHSCTASSDGRTIWYRFTATRAGTATIRTAGSSYDTVVSAYDAATLAEVPGGCHDDVSALDRSSLLNVTMSAGRTYLIEVAAYRTTEGGTLAFSFSFTGQALPGDSRASPIVIATETFSDFRPTGGHTSDAGDPVHSCTGRADGHTVWYRFTAVRAGVATISTQGSNYDTVLSVHSAASLAELSGGCHDDVANNDLSSIVQVSMVAGTSYLVEVSAYGDSPGGNLILNMAFSGGSPGPSVQVSVNTNQIRPGQLFTVGLAAQNPTGQPAADLYVGIALPDGATLVFLGTPIGVPGNRLISQPATFPSFQPLAAGSSVNLPLLLQLVVPQVPPGVYQVFAALVRAGSLADNQINPGDILAIDAEVVVVVP